MLSLLFATAVFVLFHLLVTNPFLIPLSKALGVPLLRAPFAEEAIKLIIFARLALLEEGYSYRSLILLTGLAAGIGEAIINVIFRFDILVSELNREYTGTSDLFTVYSAAFTVLLLKGVTASIGHILILCSAILLLNKRLYLFAYPLLVVVHFGVNMIIG